MVVKEQELFVVTSEKEIWRTMIQQVQKQYRSKKKRVPYIGCNIKKSQTLFLQQSQTSFLQQSQTKNEEEKFPKVAIVKDCNENIFSFEGSLIVIYLLISLHRFINLTIWLLFRLDFIFTLNMFSHKSQQKCK